MSLIDINFKISFVTISVEFDKAYKLSAAVDFDSFNVNHILNVSGFTYILLSTFTVIVPFKSNIYVSL